MWRLLNEPSIGFEANAWYGTLFYPHKLRNDIDKMLFLHECGHLVFDHKRHKEHNFDIIIQQEEIAWEYAVKIAKKMRLNVSYEFIDFCLTTYYLQYNMCDDNKTILDTWKQAYST